MTIVGRQLKRPVITRPIWSVGKAFEIIYMIPYPNDVTPRRKPTFICRRMQLILPMRITE